MSSHTHTNSPDLHLPMLLPAIGLQTPILLHDAHKTLEET